MKGGWRSFYKTWYVESATCHFRASNERDVELNVLCSITKCPMVDVEVGDEISVLELRFELVCPNFPRTESLSNVRTFWAVRIAELRSLCRSHLS